MLKPFTFPGIVLVLGIAGLVWSSSSAAQEEKSSPPKNIATDGYSSQRQFLKAAATFEAERLARPGWSAAREADVFSQDTLTVELADDLQVRFRKIAADHFVDAFPADVKQAILATPSRANDLRRYENTMETSRHGKVTVPYDFFMSETIVTNAMFKVFVRDTGYRTTVSRYRTGWIVDRHAQWLQGIANDFDQERWPFTEADHPVVQVSWFDAMQFARWLSERSGVTMRLPTFEEWALAAAPKQLRDEACVFPWGNSLEGIDRRANFGSAELDYAWVHDQFHDGHAFSSPVRAYPANERGLHDMVGNVWCWSFTPAQQFHRRPQGDRQATVPKLESLEAADNGQMAMHGGCYLARLTHLTLFAKMAHPALDGAEDIGFRLVAVRASEAGVPLRSSTSQESSTP